MSDKLTAILGEACYGSPWVCTSIYVSFESTPIRWGFQNMVYVWLIENESSRMSVYSTILARVFYHYFSKSFFLQGFLPKSVHDEAYAYAYVFPLKGEMSV